MLAEIFRAGIAAVPKGQREAAYAIGLRKNQVVRLVLLPQAIRAMLPAIVSQLVVLLKDTALGFIITYDELLYVAKQMGGRLEFGFPYIPTYIVVAIIYIGLCSLLSMLARYLEGRSAATARSPAPRRLSLSTPALPQPEPREGPLSVVERGPSSYSAVQRRVLKESRRISMASVVSSSVRVIGGAIRRTLP